MNDQWIVYVFQKGTRHVYGPTSHAKAAGLYKQFNRNRTELRIEGYGIVSKELFDADEKIRNGETE